MALKEERVSIFAEDAELLEHIAIAGGTTIADFMSDLLCNFYLDQLNLDSTFDWEKFRRLQEGYEE